MHDPVTIQFSPSGQFTVTLPTPAPAPTIRDLLRPVFERAGITDLSQPFTIRLRRDTRGLADLQILNDSWFVDVSLIFDDQVSASWSVDTDYQPVGFSFGHFSRSLSPAEEDQARVDVIQWLQGLLPLFATARIEHVPVQLPLLDHSEDEQETANDD